MFIYFKKDRKIRGHYLLARHYIWICKSEEKTILTPPPPFRPQPFLSWRIHPIPPSTFAGIMLCHGFIVSVQRLLKN